MNLSKNGHIGDTMMAVVKIVVVVPVTAVRIGLGDAKVVQQCGISLVSVRVC